MTEITLEILRAELQTALAPIRGEFDSMRGEFKSVRSEFDSIRGEFESIRSELAFIRARVTMTGSAIDVVQRDIRMLKAAVNDMAHTNVTAGGVEALHEDSQRALSRQDELEARILVLEQGKRDDKP